MASNPLEVPTLGQQATGKVLLWVMGAIGAVGVAVATKKVLCYYQRTGFICKGDK